MSMSPKEFDWLQRYQGAKDTVQGVLDTIDEDDGVSYLISPTRYGTVVGALNESIKGRKIVGGALGNDPGHLARLEREEQARDRLTGAHQAQIAENQRQQRLRQERAVADQRINHERQNNIGYPTLGDAARTQPGKTTYTPPVKPAFAWGRPK